MYHALLALRINRISFSAAGCANCWCNLKASTRFDFSFESEIIRVMVKVGCQVIDFLFSLYKRDSILVVLCSYQINIFAKGIDCVVLEVISALFAYNTSAIEYHCPGCSYNVTTIILKWNLLQARLESLYKA